MQAQVHFKVSNSLGLQGALPPQPPPWRCPWNPPGALKQAPGPPAVRATKPVLMSVLNVMKNYLARAIDSEKA